MAQQRSSRTAGRLLATAVALLVAGGGIAATRHATAPAGGARTGTPSPDCVGVVVVSSQEKSDLLARLAGVYDATGPKLDGRCVDVRVNMVASGAAADALARDWAGAPGPRPTVWTPASASWLGVLRRERTERDAQEILPDGPPSLAQSPLVLAMPRPMAEAMGWPNTPVGWSDVLALAQDPAGWGRYGHPQWGRFTLGKTSPAQSTSGLHALLATYYAATGVSADLTESDVADPRSQAFVAGVEASVLHYGSTVSTFLDGLRSADQQGGGLTYVSAVATEETQVLSYNGEHPRTPLAAVYPKDGTLVADHPYAVLRAGWVGDDQRRAAGAFLAWLLQPAQQRRFTAAGFRDHDGRLAPAHGIDDGVIPAGPPRVVHAPSPAIIARVRDSWSSLRKRARVLIVIDVSGSMEGPKLAAVQAAAAAALDQFASQDEVGLWSFSSDVEQLDPIAPLSASGPALRKDIAGLRANGSTALYGATRQAVATLDQSWRYDRINAVLLLTDGQDDERNGPSLASLLDQLRSQPPPAHVPVFTIAYGQDADPHVLAQISSASHGKAYVATDAQHVGAVFADVISNF